MKEPLQFEGHCYVLIQGDYIHPHAPVLRNEAIWYPERSMTLYEQHMYRPYVKSVVTENPWIISCYPREKVRVVGEFGEWEWPRNQTYGASVNSMTIQLLGITATIPAMVMDGGKDFKKVIKEYAKLIELANKVYKKA